MSKIQVREIQRMKTQIQDNDLGYIYEVDFDKMQDSSDPETKSILSDIVNNLNERHGRSVIALNPKFNVGWRSGTKFFSDADYIKIYHPDEEYIENDINFKGTFDKLVLYLLPATNLENLEGKDENNDCLYNAVIKYIGKYKLLPFEIRTQNKFKQFLIQLVLI